MKLDGERTFAAPRQVVWDCLSDPSTMAALMPGVGSLEIQDERHWRAKVKIPLGLRSLSLTMSFEQTEARPPEFSSLEARGNGPGAKMQVLTSFTLSDVDGVTEMQGTKMLWTAEVNLSGPLGAMGQRALPPLVKRQVHHVLDALDARILAAASAAAAVPSS